MKIYVDADACPVKQEIYRVAARYQVPVVLVARSWMRTPAHEWLELVVVEDQFDGADDWIASHVTGGEIVITSDIPLAARCIERGARVVEPRGRVIDEDTIGEQVAMRALFTHLRDLEPSSGGGPSMFGRRERSQFLQRLDETIQELRRGK